VVVSAEVSADVAGEEVVGVAPWSSEAPLVPVTPPVVVAPLGEVCAPIARATCRVHLGCRSGVSREALLACEAHVGAACAEALPDLAGRIGRRALDFDEAAFRSCVTRLELVPCGAAGDMIAAAGDACEGVFRGRLAEGTTCEAAGDCRPGLVCVAGGGGACPGVCRAPAGLGMACDAALAPCVGGLWCDAGRCVWPAVALEDACVSTAQCPAGAYCGEGPAGSACVVRLATSATCDDDDACGTGDYCKPVPGVEDLLDLGVCSPRLPRDAACAPLSDVCADGLACDEARAVCVPLPDEAGDACVADVAPCGFGTGLVCEAAACELEPLVGDACVPGEAGAGGACRFGVCRPDPLASGVGACVAFTAPGGACADDGACGALACVDGRCARPSGACHAERRDINLGFRFRVAP